METASRVVVQRLVKARLGEGLAARPVASFSLDEAYVIQSETLAALGESLGGLQCRFDDLCGAACIGNERAHRRWTAEPRFHALAC